MKNLKETHTFFNRLQGNTECSRDEVLFDKFFRKDFGSNVENN